MAIPSGVILIWAGTNATIPTGWVRETSLDDKYPKGHGAQNPNTSGGSNTHTHSDGGHTHAMDAHAHSYSTGSSGYINDNSYSGNSGTDVSCDHTHGSTSSTSTSGGTLSDTVTWASSNNEPPYYKVIFIKPSGVQAGMKAGIIVHYNGATVPSGYYYCNGSNSTPDLRDKYLKGAGSGGDAGAGSGGTSHQHTITHNHAAVNHSHTGSTGGYSGSQAQSGSNDVGNFAPASHTHIAYLGNTAATVSDYTKTDAGSGDTVEPAYKKMGLIQCSAPSMKLGMVGLWLGTVASIPNNWQVCDGTNGTVDMRDKFIKVPTDLSTNGATGGSNTHTHTGVTHTHTASGTHSHSGSTGGPQQTTGRNGSNSGTKFANIGHTHTLTSVSSVTATYQNGTSTPGSVDNQPAYLTVAYIQLMKIGGGASFLLNLI